MIIRPARKTDMERILDIYNYEVLNSTASFDIKPKALDDRLEWFEKHTGRYPVIVAEVNEKAVGYASLSPYREKEGYAATVELSVYVSAHYRGYGIGKALMEEILKMARENGGIHTVISVITGGNEISVKLHESFGFVHCGTIKEAGRKFGKYLDIENYQLMV